MGESTPQTGTVAGALGPWELLPSRHFGAEFEKQVGGGDPAQLDTVVLQPRAEEGLVNQRCISEIPFMGMLLVEITDAGQEAPGLHLEA